MNKPEWPNLVEESSKCSEPLVDRQIWTAIQKGQLVSDQAVQTSAKYACYEMRIGQTVQQLATHLTPGSNDLYVGKDIPESGDFAIRPGDTFKLFAAEKLHMPADVFAIAIPVGNLYKLGLNPETTFADPGFSGEFFVTVCNYSPRIVKLRVGDPLARVFFFHLGVRPERIHEGQPRATPLSIERVNRPSNESLLMKGESAVLKQILEAVDPPHYEHAFVTERIISFHRSGTEKRLATMERQNAAMTIVNLLSFLCAIVVVTVYLGSLLHDVWPEFTTDLVSKAGIGTVIWALTSLVVKPIRESAMGAIGVLSKGKAECEKP